MADDRKSTLTRYARLQTDFKKAFSKAKSQNNVSNLRKLIKFRDDLAKTVKAYNKDKARLKELEKEVELGEVVVDSVLHPALEVATDEKDKKTEQKKETKIEYKDKDDEKKEEKDFKSKKSSSLVMPEKKTDLDKPVPTDIPHFDELIEGGFKKNTTNLVVGNAGSGKTIFATQFLIGGLKKGEKCLFVTFEEKKEHFYTNMAQFGWDLGKYEADGLFTFLEYSPVKVKHMLEEGGGAIETIIIKEKITRIVIDSITSFALLFDDELQKREAALSLFNMINSWNCTSLLTFEGEPFEDQKIAARTLEFESDAIILFYFLREKGERHRYFEVLKMRGTKHSKKMYRFHIDKNGITVYPKPVTDVILKK